ncbi:hypothetical protein Q9S36_33750 [Microbacterium sp. ARD31]|nr:MULTISPECIES: hypothetical protein [unclassified Microbacterium]MDT0185159.1 hypothetical protein [Microbacterium sp. ARD31]
MKDLDPNEDIFDAAAQPRCPECGTLLRDVPGGFLCPTDGLSFLSTQL